MLAVPIGEVGLEPILAGNHVLGQSHGGQENMQPRVLVAALMIPFQFFFA